MKSILLLSVIAMGADKAPQDSVREPEQMICATDVKSCPDGTFVSRDGLKGCEFKPCPSEAKDKAQKPQRDSKKP